MSTEELTKLSEKYPKIKDIVDKMRFTMKHVASYAVPLTIGAGALYGTSNQ